jgi:hypothetical protein
MYIHSLAFVSFRMTFSTCQFLTAKFIVFSIVQFGISLCPTPPLPALRLPPAESLPAHPSREGTTGADARFALFFRQGVGADLASGRRPVDSDSGGIAATLARQGSRLAFVSCVITCIYTMYTLISAFCVFFR